MRYEGFYARFEAVSKKDAAVLIGADTLVGDEFDIEIRNERGTAVAWIRNRFGAEIGFFGIEATRKIQLAQARGDVIKVMLSFVAYSEDPSPGLYWGEMAVVSYPASESDCFKVFCAQISKRLQNGIRPDIALSEQGEAKVIESKGAWMPSATTPLPKKKSGMVIMKSKRRFSEHMIEQGRAGNKGCFIVGWAFILAFVAAGVWVLKQLGLF